MNDETALVFLTSPDNPSGYAPPVEELLAFHRRLPEGCLLVVDEAYMDFAVPGAPFPPFPGRRVPNCGPAHLLKLYGLAGLRLGYGLMAPELADCLLRVKLPFSVNHLAEAAAWRTGGQRVPQATLRLVIQERETLSQALAGEGFRSTPPGELSSIKPPGDAQRLFTQLWTGASLSVPSPPTAGRPSAGQHRQRRGEPPPLGAFGRSSPLARSPPDGPRRVTQPGRRDPKLVRDPRPAAFFPGRPAASRWPELRLQGLGLALEKLPLFLRARRLGTNGLTAIGHSIGMVRDAGLPKAKPRFSSPMDFETAAQPQPPPSPLCGPLPQPIGISRHLVAGAKPAPPRSWHPPAGPLRSPLGMIFLLS